MLADTMGGVDDLSALIRNRRSTLRCDDTTTIPPEVIDELCELATWAPCHKHTWPWRFASFTGNSRARLGDLFVADMLANDIGDEAKRDKTRTKYLRTPNILVVGCTPDEHPTFQAENRDAVSAAIQNILLAATDRGLSSLWSTPPVMDGEQVVALCGFEPGTRIIGVIYLGYANHVVDPPPRPPAQVLHLDA